MTVTQGPAIERAETSDAPETAHADRRTLRRSSILLLAGTILQPIASQLHPTSGTDVEWDVGVASMLEDDAWVPAHLLEAVSIVMMLAAMVMIARTPTVRGLRALRYAVIAVAVGLSIHLADLVPHTLAASEAEEMLAGGSTPLFDTHVTVQAVVTLILGFGIAALAVLDARRSPRWTWIPASLAVIGGLIGAVSGPIVAVTRDPSYTVLFIGFAGMSIWLLVTAIRRFVAVRRSVDVALT